MVESREKLILLFMEEEEAAEEDDLSAPNCLDPLTVNILVLGGWVVMGFEN